MNGRNPADVDLFADVNKPLNPMSKQRVRVTRGLLFFERSGLTTNAQQIPVSAIQDVDAVQSMTQKARGVGSVRLLVRRPGGVENVLLEDFVSFRQLVDVINHVSREARAYEMRAQRTQTIHYQGSPPQPQGFAQGPGASQPPAQPAGGAQVDPIEQLERLGKLRDSGVITDEEFQAKKREWLSRM